MTESLGCCANRKVHPSEIDRFY